MDVAGTLRRQILLQRQTTNARTIGRVIDNWAIAPNHNCGDMRVGTAGIDTNGQAVASGNEQCAGLHGLVQLLMGRLKRLLIDPVGVVGCRAGGQDQGAHPVHQSDLDGGREDEVALQKPPATSDLQ